MKLIRFLFLFSLIGAVICFLVLAVITSGLFVRWERVAQIPEKTFELVGAVPGAAFVQSKAGGVLSCAYENLEECWIPDIVTENSAAEPCSQHGIAFSPLAQSPRNIRSCVQNDVMYNEMKETILYAVDENGYLWEWSITSSSYDILLYPFVIAAGGLGGMLLGSIAWALKTIGKKNVAPAGKPLFAKAQLVLLALPWICLISGITAWETLIYHPQPARNSGTPNIVTYAAETVIANQAEESKKWEVVGTSSPGKVRYSFSGSACDAKWTDGFDQVPCGNNNVTSDRMVRILTNPSLEGIQMKGDALWIHITPYDHSIEGEYLTIQIQKGDHFRATLGCLEKSACDLVFEVFYELQNKGIRYLGRWNPKNDGKLEKIDLDLSDLVGESVRFFLTVEDYNNSGADQDGVWLMPRIEH